MGVPIWTRVAHVLSARGEFLQLECWGPWGLVPWKSGKLQVLSVISGFQSGEWLQLRPAKCLQAPHSKILVISWPSIPTIDIHRPCKDDEFGRLQFQEIGQYQHLKLVINCSLPFISQKMLIVWLFRDYINMSVCHAKACCSSEDNLDEQMLKDLESDERMVMVPVPLTPGRTQWIWQELMQSYPYCGESFVCPWCLYALIPSPKMIYRPSPQCIVLDLVILGSQWGGLTDADWAARLFRALFEITMSLSSDRRKLAMDGEFFSWPCRYVLFGHRLWSISKYIQTALKETYPIEILTGQNRKNICQWYAWCDHASYDFVGWRLDQVVLTPWSKDSSDQHERDERPSPRVVPGTQRPKLGTEAGAA